MINNAPAAPNEQLIPVRGYQEANRIVERLVKDRTQSGVSCSLEKRFTTAEHWTYFVKFKSPSSGKLLLVTTGLHGIEGYAGNLFLQYLDRHFLTPLLVAGVNVWLVHALNPWGMANYRRGNEHNIDLNRNCLEDYKQLPQNSAYSNMMPLFQPQGKVVQGDLKTLPMLIRLLVLSARQGRPALKAAFASGQYDFPKGIFYGGKEEQPQTSFLKRLFEEVLLTFGEIIHLDIHSGVGPKNRMSIINSSFETAGPAGFERQFNYSPVIRPNAAALYPIHGDTIDYFYRLKQKQKFRGGFYSCALEYATLGESLPAIARTAVTLIAENSGFHHGYSSTSTKEKVNKLFLKLFYPLDDPAWLMSFQNHSRRALQGILSAYGYL